MSGREEWGRSHTARCAEVIKAGAVIFIFIFVVIGVKVNG